MKRFWICLAIPMVWGCGNDDVPLTLKVKQVKRDAIKIGVKTEPGETVAVSRNDPKVANDKGRATLTINVPTEIKIGSSTSTITHEIMVLHVFYNTKTLFCINIQHFVRYI